jgi:hypothetical protein
MKSTRKRNRLKKMLFTLKSKKVETEEPEDEYEQVELDEED